MSENEREAAEPRHREEVDHLRQVQEKERALVEALFEQALARHQGPDQRIRALVEVTLRGERDRRRGHLPPGQTAAIHYTQLPESPPGSPMAGEWDLYRREVGRLLAEGNEGKWILF